jgi:hypothetical protein
MILIFCEVIYPRVEYTFRLIFTQILGVEVVFTTFPDEFISSELPKINYSLQRFPNDFYIKPNPLLFEEGISAKKIQPVKFEEEIYFFDSSADSVFPFDPFAAAFYLVTRYEEYENRGGTKFDRYDAKKSILTKYNLLKKPVINIWAKLLAEKLQQYFPGFIFPERKFQFFSTIDVDNAWAFKHKGFWRSSAALIKSVFKGNVKESVFRLNVLLGNNKDPFDTYDFLDSVFEGNEEKVRFFFLLGDYGKFDKNISPKNKYFKELIQKTAKKYTVGVHPSFSAGQETGSAKMKKELALMENIFGEKVYKSRQHFLLLRLPKTYRRLLEANIFEDYTMGFAEQTGFRAGICTPFYYYDLEKEATTNLRVVPFQVMDVTLREYMGLNPEAAEKEIFELMQEVKNVGGTFVSIWHNETVSDYGNWKGFREVFEKMNQTGFAWANE